MTRKFAVIAAAAAVALGNSSLALAASKTANVTVSATVPKNCLISAGTLAFGSYDPLGANASTNLDQSGSFTVTCTKTVAWAVGLDAGQNAANVPGGVTATRAMSEGSNYLGYEIFTSSTRGTVWDNTSMVSGTGTGTSQTVTLYGRVPAGQTGTPPSAVSYGDTVVATVNF
jgi:spore coat protein U-like protein